jgi:hypothetical protein
MNLTETDNMTVSKKEQMAAYIQNRRQPGDAHKRLTCILRNATVK